MLFFVNIWSADINDDLKICSQTWRLLLGLASKLRVELIKDWELRQETFTVGIKFLLSWKKFESRILSWTF